jgi:hypothetical protein
MPYLRTRLATDFPKGRSIGDRIVGALLFFIPRGNPDYEARLHLVREWLVECDEAGVPWREIGLDEGGTPVLSGPDDRNYGFWCDTNMTSSDFDGEEIGRALFEEQWQRAATLRHGEVSAADEPDGDTTEGRILRL